MEVQAHLLGHAPNLTVDILKLQQETDQMSAANLQLLPGEEVLSAAADGLWLKSPYMGEKPCGRLCWCSRTPINNSSCLLFSPQMWTTRPPVKEETAKSVYLLLKKKKAKQKSGGYVGDRETLEEL